jgi:membrane-bound inhibitor of C-type lysozyme
MRGIKSMLHRRLTRSIAVGATAVAIGGGAYGIVSATAGTGTGTATAAISPTATVGRPVPGGGGGGSNARSGPAAGGSVGTVASVSKSSFTLSTSAGQTVTVNRASSTTYRKGTTSLSASAVKKGQNVLVLGTTNGTTITASQVIVQATGSGGSAAAVVPFQQGAPSTAKQVGQIPASYTEGSGTIVSGATANKATEAALASYPGGVVDRVVKLSNGEYEVHNIGVNWPHHVFVSKNFKVVGSD